MSENKKNPDFGGVNLPERPASVQGHMGNAREVSDFHKALHQEDAFQRDQRPTLDYYQRYLPEDFDGA